MPLWLYLEDVIVRFATHNDIDEVKRLADANRESLGFITRPAFVEAVDKEWLLVARDLDDKLLGFARFRHRLDNVTTLYEICVDQRYRRLGVGWKLLRALKEDALLNHSMYIQLKAPSHLTGNTDFYTSANFEWEYSILANGKRRPLNVWRYVLW